MSLRPAHFYDLIIFGALPWDYQVARHIRKKHELFLQFFIISIGLSEQIIRLRFKFAHLFLNFLRLGFLALLHEAAYLCGKLLLLCQKRVAFRLKSFPMIVQL